MNRSLVFIGLALFTWGIGEGIFVYFQSIHLGNLGADPVAIGSILGAMGMVMYPVSLGAIGVAFVLMLIFAPRPAER